MTHHLNDMEKRLSRRQALAAACGGVTALIAWPRAVRAHERAIPEFTVTFVSDTHLGREEQTTGAERWTQAAREIDKSNSELVLHLGDVVDNGRESQYAVYKDIRKSIHKPVWEIPGNHDPHELFAKHVRRNIDTSFDHRGVRFLLINNARYGATDGFIAREQILFLTQQCREAANRGLFIVIAMHVPAHTNNDHLAVASYVKPGHGQKELYDLVERHKDRVLGLVHGHFHCGLRGWDSHAPLQEIVCPSTLYNRNLLLTIRQAPGFNVLEFRPGYVLAKFAKEGLQLTYKVIGSDDSPIKKLKLEQFQS